MNSWIFRLLVGLLILPSLITVTIDREVGGRESGWRKGTPDHLPSGVASGDWEGIARAHDEWRHGYRDVAGRQDLLVAENPGQQLALEFDGRGFVAWPRGRGWSWGLELVSYGVGGRQRRLDDMRGFGATTRAAQREGRRLSYQRDGAIEEWYVNDRRGLEHGFTLHERPAGERGRLNLTLGVRGGLRPRVKADAVGFHSGESADGRVAVLNYAGLKVWDADGRGLASWFEPAGDDAIRIVVDERDARYPITIDPTVQQAYLKASHPGANYVFGSVVAISGDTVVVGSYGDGSNATGINGDASNTSAPYAGAAYVFVRSGGTWSQQAYLKGNNTESLDFFGGAVAISGDTIVVGASSEDSNVTGVNGNGANNSASSAGAAYVFVRNGTTWSQQAYLKASNTGSNDQFGVAVGISGDTIVVGAAGEYSSSTGVNGDQANNNGTNNGAAYVFVRSGTTWSQEAYLKASNSSTWNYFGQAVAISGETVVVGAWGEESNATGIDGDQTNRAANAAGAAYVFVRSAGTWSQQAYLKASNTTSDDYFGRTLAINGQTIVVGAYRESGSATGVNGDETNSGQANSGAAYVFVRNGTTWSQQAYLKASNTGASDNFGSSVAVNGNVVAVGAFGEDSDAMGVGGDQTNDLLANSGAVYLFERSGTTWTQNAYIKAGNAGTGDNFGSAVAIAGTTLLAGSYWEDSNATGINGNGADNSVSNSGAVYVFDLDIAPPPTIAVSAPVTLTGTTGTAYSQNFTQSGALGTVSFRTGSTLPTGMSLAANGTLSGTPTQSGSFTITVTATDDIVTAGSVTVTLTINSPCPAITVTAPVTLTGASGTAYSQNFTQSGGSGAIAYTTSSTLPTGMTLAANGTLSGTPTQTGSFALTVTATDGNGCTGSVTVTLAISAPCPVITVTAPGNLTATVGTVYNRSFTQSGGSGAITYTTSSTLPAGLTLAANGTLSGTPTQSGSHTITVTATDGNGCTGAVTVTLTITGGCPVVTVLPPVTRTGNVGTAYSQSFTQSGGSGTITYTSGSTLPPGLTFNANGRLSGTPTQTGSFSITVTVTDSNGCQGTVTTTLTISPCIPPTIGGLKLTFGLRGRPVYQTLQALDAQGRSVPATFTITGTLPAGITLSANGILSGESTDVGTFLLTARATTAGGCVATLPFEFSIFSEIPVNIGDYVREGGAGDIFDVLAQLGNGTYRVGETGEFVQLDREQMNAPTVMSYTATMPVGPVGSVGPVGIAAVAGSCVVATGVCTIAPNGLTVTWSGTLQPGEVVAIRYQVKILSSAIPGTTICIESATTSNGNPYWNYATCVGVTAAKVGPGSSQPAISALSDQRPGSVLIYNLYTSSVNTDREETRITLTNTNPTQAINVHLLFVDGSSGAVADQYVRLTANQTVSLLASEVDPGMTGYLLAVATDEMGCPTGFNHLVGEALVKLESGHRANLPALGVAAIAGGLRPCDETSVTAELAFDGVSYNPLPRTLALDSLDARATGNNTLLVVNRLGGDLTTGAARLGTLAGLLFDDLESSQSFTLPAGNCQLRGVLGNNFPRTAPRYETVIPAGRTGWMKLWTVDNAAMTGAQINQATVGFSQGHNLHALSTTTATVITIPVYPAR